LDNAVLRENFQRNYLQNKIKEFSDEDLIIISDLDEIPNLKNFDYKARITFFEQKMFYYKLNLVQNNFVWYGSRICKKKHLINPQWLRNIKSKRYPLWKLNFLFSKKKYNNVNFIKNGGWHFTNIKTPEEIDYKMKNYLHHLEYEESGLDIHNIKNIISEKKIIYDHNIDKRGKKWNSSIKLIKEEERYLPDYIIENKIKFLDWID
jgi:beta-1,4-mannosyl-glycoprotein beta-1,4-N-acetylglucosaminyltransferase